MLADDRLLDLLKRRFELAYQASDLHVHLEALRFDTWIRSHALLRDHVRAIERDRGDANARLRRAEAEVVQELRALRGPLLAIAPTWKKGVPYSGTKPETVYSLERFDLALEGRGGADLAGPPPAQALTLAQTAARDCASDDPAAQKDVDAIRICLQELARRYGHAVRSHAFEQQVSPGAALAELERTRATLLPLPQDETGHLVLEDAIRRGSVELMAGQVPGRAAPVRDALRRVYEELHARVCGELSHHELVGRFKVRCEWYDRERVAALAAATPRKKEAPLVLELARFLFDNGVDVLINPKVADLELDALGFDRPILVEGKAYSDKGGRGEILDAYAQTSGYLNDLDGTRMRVSQAHLVVFRLGGPLYRPPTHFPLGEKVILTTVVDLASAEERGSRQGKGNVIQIRAEEIVAWLAKEKSKPASEEPT